MDKLDELMAQHNISVWADPNWRSDLGAARWLAGQNIRAESDGPACETCGYSEEYIVADNTHSGHTPSEAVMACAAARGAA